MKLPEVSTAWVIGIAMLMVVAAVGVFRAIPERVPLLPEMTLAVARASTPARVIAQPAVPAQAKPSTEPKRWPEVIARAEAELERANGKPDDTYHAWYQLLLAHHATGNKAAERRALQGMIDSGFLRSDQQVALVRALNAMNSQRIGE